MTTTQLSEVIEDHALESVPLGSRKSWIELTWNTASLVTTLIWLLFGALSCFVAGTKIALLAGFAALLVGSALAWGIARVAYDTGLSNTLITRKYGLGIRGSALASISFALLIIGFLALENALLFRGVIFFFELDDSLLARVLIYSCFTVIWIVLTTFGFALVTRSSSFMLISFLFVLLWVTIEIISTSGRSFIDSIVFETQFPLSTLEKMGVHSNLDKFIFVFNIEVGGACALALNIADFGRYSKSTAHAGVAATIGLFCHAILMLIIGGMLMYAGEATMVDYYSNVQGITGAEAQEHVLRNTDSIAATFIVFSGGIGFTLMFLAQAKAQVLNCYSSSLCLSNLFDAVFKWRPGRFAFVILANVIALIMLYGHILEFIEAWIKLIGVLLSAIASIIILDYFVVSPRTGQVENESFNWAGAISLVCAVVIGHWLLRPYQPIEVFTSIATVIVLYPALRLFIFRPHVAPA